MPVVLDEVALDSAENVILGLMALRLREPQVRIKRIGFYSLWQFKKQRMTKLAKELGVENQFYFSALALAELANAGRLAQEGEEKQLAVMAANHDYLLRGKEWEAKRVGRYNGAAPYRDRDAGLRAAFPAVFAALDGLRSVTLGEVLAQAGADPARDVHEVVGELRRKKLDEFREAFAAEVLNPR